MTQGLDVKRMRLRTKIVLWTFVPTALILNLVTWFTFYTYQKVTEQLVVERNRELTRLLAGQIADRLADYASPLEDLAALLEEQEGETTSWQDLLDAQSRFLRAFDGGVAILDASDTVVAGSAALAEAVGLDWSGQPFLSRNDVRALQIFGIDPHPSSGESAVMVVVPSVGSADQPPGRVVGFVQISGQAAAEPSPFYSLILREMRRWEGGDFYLVDGSGQAIYHTHPARVGQAMTAQEGVRQLLADQTGAFRTRDLAGVRIVIAFAPVPDTPWGLVTEEDWAGLAAASQRYRFLLILFLVTGLLAPIVLVTLGVRQITRPIRILTGAAQEIAAGDFDQRIAVHTGDELEDLAQQFNDMALQLRESYALLERRVSDRTRELAALYRIATVARASLDLEEILQRSLEQTLQVMDCEVGALHLFDPESRTLTLAAWRGLSPSAVARAAAVPLGGGLISQVFTQGQTMSVDRATDSPHPLLVFSATDQPYAGAPMRTKEQKLGVLSVLGKPGDAFGAEEQALLAAVADQVAVAVENTRLRAEAEQVAVLQERERLARDLHDSVTQSLYSLTLWIEAGQRSLRAGDLLRIEEYLARLEDGTRQAIRDMRLLVYELRPPALEEEGLIGALQERLDAVEKRSGVQAQLIFDPAARLPAAIEIELYRIAQEALNNALKHAAPAAVTVRLSAVESGIELCIIDDGIGFDLDAVRDRGGMGLANMRQRARHLGGRLSVRSAPAQGTRICVTVPWTAVGLSLTGEEDE